MTTPPAESSPSGDPSQPSVPPQPLPPTPKPTTKPTQSATRKPRQRKRADQQDKPSQPQPVQATTSVAQRECLWSIFGLVLQFGFSPAASISHRPGTDIPTISWSVPYDEFALFHERPTLWPASWSPWPTNKPLWSTTTTVWVSNAGPLSACLSTIPVSSTHDDVSPTTPRRSH
jgi:hypothetical protein